MTDTKKHHKNLDPKPFGNIVVFVPDGINPSECVDISALCRHKHTPPHVPPEHTETVEYTNTDSLSPTTESLPPSNPNISNPNMNKGVKTPVVSTDSTQPKTETMPSPAPLAPEYKGLFATPTTDKIPPFGIRHPLTESMSNATPPIISAKIVPLQNTTPPTDTTPRPENLDTTEQNHGMFASPTTHIIAPFTLGNDGHNITPDVQTKTTADTGVSETTIDTNADESAVTMHYDVIIIGAGPSGISTAIRIKQITRQNNQDISVCVLEKGNEIGAHIMSGAVLEPRALNELIPDWHTRNAPLDCPAKKESFLFLTKNKAFKMPTPRHMHNQGNYIISLGNFCKWLATQAQELGVEIYTGVSADTILYDTNNRIIGVATGDMGINKDGTHSPQYAQGMHMMATYTVFSEGCRGSLSQQLMDTFDLRQHADPQTYGIGLKELWEIPPENAHAGHIIHTVGWPMDNKTYGGSFLYHLNDNMVAIGFVVGLDYQNPHLSPYMEFQRLKHHPTLKKILTGGRRVSYGARALNEGGYQSIPNTAFPGGVMVGCSAGFLNVPKIKGTHTAMKSGMLAGECIANALLSNNTPAILESYVTALKNSWIHDELYQVRNIRPSFYKGLFTGLVYSAFDAYILRGKAPWTFKNHADYTRLKPADACKKIDYPKPDGVYSFDRLTNVSYSNTYHGENQPSHLKIKDARIPIDINLKTYDAPEQRYCPAGVYEIVKQDGDWTLQVNAQNCLHCKTCDIKDPTQNIQWTCPEGSGGPNYSNM